MRPIQPPAPFHIAADSTIIDASTLLYRPADRAMVVEEQVALFAARQALARWTSGSIAPIGAHAHGDEPFRAAYYARARQEFVSWLKRGGVWEDESALDTSALRLSPLALPLAAVDRVQAIDACDDNTPPM